MCEVDILGKKQMRMFRKKMDIVMQQTTSQNNEEMKRTEKRRNELLQRQSSSVPALDDDNYVTYQNINVLIVYDWLSKQRYKTLKMKNIYAALHKLDG